MQLGRVGLGGHNMARRLIRGDQQCVVFDRLPKVVDGVSVKVGGQDAYVYYVSDSQINALVPAEAKLGLPKSLKRKAPWDRGTPGPTESYLTS